MKGLLLFVVFVLFLTSCGQVSKDKAVKIERNAKLDQVSWADYYKWIHPDNQHRLSNFKKLKDAGSKILAVGTVYERFDDDQYKDNGSWCFTTIQVKMTPSHGVLKDIQLKIPKKYEKDIPKYGKSDLITFKTKIAYIGSGMSDHVMEAEKIAKGDILKKKKKRR